MEVLPVELKLMITDQLDDVSYYSLRVALFRTKGPFPNRLIKKLFDHRQTMIKGFLDEGILHKDIFAASAVRENRLDLLKLNREYLNLSFQLSEIAAWNGHLKILEWLVFNGAPVGIHVAKAAIRGKQLNTLKWILQKRPELDLEKLRKYALIHGDLFSGRLLHQ